MINLTFNSRVGWNEDCVLTLEGFLSCYQHLQWNLPVPFEFPFKCLYDLMEMGFTITETDYISFEQVFGYSVEDIIAFSSTVLHMDKSTITDCIYKARFTDKDKMTVEHINLNNFTKNSSTQYHLFKKLAPKSKQLILLLENGCGKTLNPSEKAEIKDLFGEPTERDRLLRPITSTVNQFALGVIHEEANKVPEFNKTVFDKEDLRKLLCDDYQYANLPLAGYGERCPICGHKSHAGLNGMRFNKFSKNNKQHYLLSCLNCHEMLYHAEDITLPHLDQLMEKFKYFYVSDNLHRKNKRPLLTTDLEVVTAFNDTLHLQIKLSYLNLLIYYRKNGYDKQ